MLSSHSINSIPTGPSMMVTLIVLLCFSPIQAAGQNDGSAIQGQWRPVKLILPGQHHVPAEQLTSIVLTLKEGKYTSTGGPQVEAGTYVLDPLKEPRWITMTATRGPTAGATVHAIYTLKAQTLTIVYPVEPGAPRPTTLEGHEAGAWVFVEYVRIE